jgi:hypothetical protein
MSSGKNNHTTVAPAFHPRWHRFPTGAGTNRPITPTAQFQSSARATDGGVLADISAPHEPQEPPKPPTPLITPELTKSIESLDPDTLTDLLTSFLFEGEPLRDLAARLNLTLTQLIAWHDHPRTQAMMDHLDRIATARAARQKVQATPDAIHALHLITQIHPANKPETTRKAATTLLKVAPAPVAPAPVAPASSRCGHQPPISTNRADPISPPQTPNLAARTDITAPNESSRTTTNQVRTHPPFTPNHTTTPTPNQQPQAHTLLSSQPQSTEQPPTGARPWKPP